MDKETFLQAIQEIGTCEDEIQRRTLLAQMSDEVVKIYDSNESLANSNKQFESDNETLRKANMDLFLRIGADKTDFEKQKDTTGITQEENEKRKFENLFDEKGGIK